MQVLASQLHFLANKNAELATPPLFWPVNCIKIGGHVALLSDPTAYSLYCDVAYHVHIYQTHEFFCQVLLLHENNIKDLRGGGDLNNLSELRVRLQAIQDHKNQ